MMPRDAHFSFSRGDWWAWLTEWLILDRRQGRTKYRDHKSSHSNHGLECRRWVRPQVCKNFQSNLFSWVIFGLHDKLITSNWTVKLVSKCKHHILYFKKILFCLSLLGNFRCVLNLLKQYSQYGSQFLEFSTKFRSLTSWIMYRHRCLWNYCSC